MTTIAIITLFYLAFTKTSYAQAALSVYPPVMEIQTTPPSSPNAPITITNDSKLTASIAIQLIPFSPSKSNDGSITLQPELMNKGFYRYYAERVQFILNDQKINSLTVEPGEKKDIIVNINLEPGDPPGDFYYAIVFLQGGEHIDDASYTQIPIGVTTNLLLSVGPKSKINGGIPEFDTKSFYSKGPVVFNLKLHNASNHLLESTGTISIKNILGKKVGEVKLLPQYVLANSDRYLTDEFNSANIIVAENNIQSQQPVVIWDEKFLLGFYTAEAQVVLEENSIPISTKTYFVAFPLYFFAGIVVVLFITISIYLRVRKKI